MSVDTKIKNIKLNKKTGEPLYFLSCGLYEEVGVIGEYRSLPFEGVPRHVRHSLQTEEEIRDAIDYFLTNPNIRIRHLEVFRETDLDKVVEFDEEAEIQLLQDKKECNEKHITKREWNFGSYQSSHKFYHDIVIGFRDENGNWIGKGDDPDPRYGNTKNRKEKS